MYKDQHQTVAYRAVGLRVPIASQRRYSGQEDFWRTNVSLVPCHTHVHKGISLFWLPLEIITNPAAVSDWVFRAPSPAAGHMSRI